jgi:tetratricopeptide (TPR) repeat protein
MKHTAKTTIGAAALAALLLLPAATGLAAETDDVTTGISLVKKGHYQEGAATLRKALEKNPESAEANYYLGVALNRTTEGKEAESLLKRALMENPEDPALNLELGMHYFNKQVPAEAADYFEEVIRLAPGSGLADKSREYLKKIDESRKEKSWSLSIFAGGQYDTNVILNGRDMPLPQGYSGKSDWSALVNLKGAYTPLKTGDSEAGISYSYYQNLHASLKKFDMIQNLAEVSASHAFSPHVTLKGTYSFEYLLLNQNDYDFAHGIAPSLIFRSDKLGTTILDYRLRITDYRNSDQFPDNSDRSGLNHLFGLTQIVPISESSTIWAAYNHDTERTKRLEWDYEGERLLLGARYLLPLGLMADISGDVYWKGYRAQDPQFLQTRNDTQYSLNVAVSKNFSDTYSISLSESASRNNSNIPEFKYDRSITSIIFSARF